MQELANSSEKNDKNDKSKLSTGTPLPFYVTQSGQPTQPTQSGQPAQQLQSARPVNASQSSLSTQPVFSVRFSATKLLQDTDTSSSDACGKWFGSLCEDSGNWSHSHRRSTNIRDSAHDAFLFAFVLALLLVVDVPFEAQRCRPSLVLSAKRLYILGERWKTVRRRYSASSGGFGVPSRWVWGQPFTPRRRRVLQLCVDGVGHGV